MTSVFLLEAPYHRSLSFHVLCAPHKWWILSWDEAKSLRVYGSPLLAPCFRHPEGLLCSFPVFPTEQQFIQCHFPILLSTDFPSSWAWDRLLFVSTLQTCLFKATGFVASSPLTCSSFLTECFGPNKVTTDALHRGSLCEAAAGGIPRKNLQLGSSGAMQTSRVFMAQIWPGSRSWRLDRTK